MKDKKYKLLFISQKEKNMNNYFKTLIDCYLKFEAGMQAWARDLQEAQDYLKDDTNLKYSYIQGVCRSHSGIVQNHHQIREKTLGYLSYQPYWF